jgi:hypothetical protein
LARRDREFRIQALSRWDLSFQLPQETIGHAFPLQQLAETAERADVGIAKGDPDDLLRQRHD